MQPAPQLRPPDRAQRVDALLGHGVAQVALDVVVGGSNDREPGGDVLDQTLERLEHHR
jgi:hypothetical protein